MSIDDKFLRDPRVTQLALDLDVSRWEAMGRLLAVFAVCYDLERDVITPAQVDLAGEREGLADALFAVDLAVTTRRGLRIRGVKKRIEYLAPKREAGRQGGIKSGESRRKSAKQKREKREATVNPPDPVPDLVPDPVPDPDPVPEDRNSLAPARAIPPGPDHAPPPASTPPPGQSAWHRRQAWWTAMLEADARVKAAGIEPAAPPLANQPAGELERAMLACEQQFELGYGAQQVDAKMRHVVLVAEAEAMRDRNRRFFKPALIWDPKRAARAADTPLEEARRPRAGAADPAPPRRPGDPARGEPRSNVPNAAETRARVVVVAETARAASADVARAALAQLFPTQTTTEPETP